MSPHCVQVFQHDALLRAGDALNVLGYFAVCILRAPRCEKIEQPRSQITPQKMSGLAGYRIRVHKCKTKKKEPVPEKSSDFGNPEIRPYSVRPIETYLYTYEIVIVYTYKIVVVVIVYTYKRA